jgi:tetratricopeptide (TPR) repeat protein
MLATLAWTEAMLGRLADARSYVSQGHASLRELGLRIQEGIHAVLAGYVEVAASDPVAAATWFHAANRILAESGERWFRSLSTLERARAVYDQGRYDDARALAEALDRAAEIDPEWRAKDFGLEAKLAARASDHAAAFRYADQALAVAMATDFVLYQSDALLDKAEVCFLSGQEKEAESAARQALQLLEEKGSIAGAAKARALLARLKGV